MFPWYDPVVKGLLSETGSGYGYGYGSGYVAERQSRLSVNCTGADLLVGS